jgi:opacity protein-like surface antigen
MSFPSPVRRLAGTVVLMLAAALPAVAAGSTPAAGEVQPYGDLSDQHFWLSLGAFLPNFDTTATLDSEVAGIPGATINTEDDLGLDEDNTNFRFDFVWHIAPRHALTARYFEFTRSASKLIDADIQYGDVMFAANTTVETESKLAYYGVAYRYSFTLRDGVDVYLIAGFDTLDVEATLGGSGTLTGGGGTIGAFSGERSGGMTAPVPVLGIGLSIELTHRLFLHEEFELFGIKVQGINGSLSYNRVSLDWHPFKHIGFGLGYDRLRLQAAEDDDHDTDFDFDYELNGARFYVTGTF